MMELDFDNKEIKKLFNDWSLMGRKIGHELARLIKKRHDQAKSYVNVGELLTQGLGHPEQLQGNKHLISVHIDKNRRIIYEIPDYENIKSDTAKVHTVNKIIVKEVSDYHGDKITKIL